MRAFIFISSLFISLNGWSQSAERYSIDQGIHTIGIGGGYGSINGNLADSIDNNQGAWAFYYNYALDSTYSVEVSYNTGDTDNAFCILCGLFESDLEINNQKYETIILSGRGTVPLSQRWYLFSKVGLNRYDSRAYRRHEGRNYYLPSENGIGFYGAAGIEFRAYNGFGVNFELHYLDIGKIDSSAGMINLSYLF